MEDDDGKESAAETTVFFHSNLFHLELRYTGGRMRGRKRRRRRRRMTRMNRRDIGAIESHEET